MKAQEKLQKSGEKLQKSGQELYDFFVMKMADSFAMTDRVSMPRTGDLEKFALLKKKRMDDVLFVEMVKEYLSNFIEVKLSVEKGRLYHHFETRDRI